MKYEDVEVGMKVRYHPIIGGPHDEKVYVVSGKKVLGDQRGKRSGPEVAWLEGKSGCVSVEALSFVHAEFNLPLYQVTEMDLATVWAESRCPKCQEGTCELTASEHAEEIAAYYALPEKEREDLRNMAIRAFDNSTVNEMAMDVLWKVVEKS